MKTQVRLVWLSLVTLLSLNLIAVPSMAGTLYDNGPFNGTVDSWTINFGFSVSDSYTSAASATGMDFVYWDASNTDTLTTVDIASGASSFGGTPHTYNAQSLALNGGATNQYGYYLFEAVVSRISGFVNNGYVTLSNACTVSGCSVTTPIYWDENSGAGCTSPGCPSTAYENTLGSIPSEAFTLTGSSSTTPEPSSIMLLGSGIMGLTAVLRRRWMG
jgi:hypothetical protein